MLRLLNFRCSFCSNPLDETHDDLSRELVAHAVGAGADSWCEGQWETSPAQPEELPTQPVGTVVEQIAPPRAKPGFERFDFGRAE